MLTRLVEYTEDCTNYFFSQNNMEHEGIYSLTTFFKHLDHLVIILFNCYNSSWKWKTIRVQICVLFFVYDKNGKKTRICNRESNSSHRMHRNMSYVTVTMYCASRYTRPRVDSLNSKMTRKYATRHTIVYHINCIHKYVIFLILCIGSRTYYTDTRCTLIYRVFRCCIMYPILSQYSVYCGFKWRWERSIYPS